MRRVLQDLPDLLDGNPGKPLHKITNLRPVLEVFKERRYGHPGSAKYPSTADFVGTPFHGFTGRPNAHNPILNPSHGAFNQALNPAPRVFLRLLKTIINLQTHPKPFRGPNILGKA